VLWVGLVLLMEAGVALAAGLASWASRPEAWSQGIAIPVHAAAAWVGIAAPVLGPTAAAVGAFLVARRLGRSGELDAWRGLGVGGVAQWRALAPVWMGLALIALVSAWWAEPAAWAHTIELREALRGPGSGAAVVLPGGGVVLFDGEDLHLRRGDIEAHVQGIEETGPGSFETGAMTVRSSTGSWVARRARLRHRMLVPNARRLPPIASSAADLRHAANGADLTMARRAAAVLHRRASTPFLVFLLSGVGWALGTSAGVWRRPRAGLPSLTLVASVVGVLASARIADRAVPTSPVPAWLLGWTPVLSAGVVLLALGLYARRSRSP
jgi:lipopolysaccharide export LptBFGC system permease protein LptF